MNDRTARTADYIVTAFIVAFFTALILWIWQDFYGRMTEFACDTEEQIVQEGDTVYDLVMANCVGNLDVAVDANVDVYGTNIQIGQSIYLVSHEGCLMRVTDGGEVYEDC